MKFVALGMLAIGVLLALVIAGLIIFGTAQPPVLLASVTKPFESMDFGTLPPLQRYQARDGAKLSLRTYAAGQSRVAVLIHGSAGDGRGMHALALALQRAGITVFVPDLRGHGANTPHGDIAYLGQLDDDMADLLEDLQPRFPDAKWTLVGFSSGGGFALRVAADVPLGRRFDRYILLSPYLRYDAPTLRSISVGEDRNADRGRHGSAAPQVWAKAYVGRIVGLTILHRFGVHAFDGLPVVAFAVPPNEPSVTGHYSLRLQQNFGPHDDYAADIRTAVRPLRVFIGAADELFLPDKMREVFQSRRPDVPVTVLADLNHSGMVTSPEAIEAVVAACRESGAAAAQRNPAADE